MLFLVVLDHNYGERVPVQLGTGVRDYLVVTMTEKQLQQTRNPGKRYISVL